MDQYLPINKTKSFAKTEKEKVNHLLQTLSKYKNEINDKNKFYKNVIGFTFNTHWLPLIIKHQLFNKDNITGIKRLSELGLHYSTIQFTERHQLNEQHYILSDMLDINEKVIN